MTLKAARHGFGGSPITRRLEDLRLNKLKAKRFELSECFYSSVTKVQWFFWLVARADRQLVPLRHPSAVGELVAKRFSTSTDTVLTDRGVFRCSTYRRGRVACFDGGHVFRRSSPADVRQRS